LEVGIWDVFFQGEDDPTKLRCLASCAETVELSHLHWRHFLIARSLPELEEEADKPVVTVPVGSCSRYMSPVSADATYDGLKEVARRLLNWTDDQHREACERLNFLRDEASWPDLPIFQGTCFLETVFTEASHRGRGVASGLIRRCIEDGRQMGAARCFLLAAIGNNGATRVYHKAGVQSSLGIPAAAAAAAAAALHA
jgi:GNAT superfamily N-acetyltransferase